MNLETHYLGLALAHPIVASASPLSDTVDGILKLEEAGAAAIVMSSLFEEEIRRNEAVLETLLAHGTDSFAESLDYFPAPLANTSAADRYLERIRHASERLDVPLIASLNGSGRDGWVEFARSIESAGADALELNLHFVPTDLALSGSEVEARYLEILQAVKASVSLPVALKLGPWFSAFGHFAKSLDAHGADALVLFNRFYQPDIDLETLMPERRLDLSTAAEIRLPLLWIAALHGQIKASIAASTGVEGPREAIKYLLAGADVVMSTSATLRRGPTVLGEIRDGLKRWLEQQGYESLAQMRGVASLRHVENPEAFERANYLHMLEDFRSHDLG